MIYNRILSKVKSGKKQFAVLIDPDKYNAKSLNRTISEANDAGCDFILVGGSLTSASIDDTVKNIKKITTLPVLLFPGNLMQISLWADGIFLLSLISGRNPELLIGNHVIAAPVLKKSKLEIISTGYILVENGHCTSVEYMSSTRPIPRNKTDIAAATAIAGEMIGNKLIYLEAGSGAGSPVSTDMIKEVKKNISIPLVVGGGIRSKENAAEILKAGADIIIVGNAIEKNSSFISEIAGVVGVW